MGQALAKGQDMTGSDKMSRQYTDRILQNGLGMRACKASRVPKRNSQRVHLIICERGIADHQPGCGVSLEHFLRHSEFIRQTDVVVVAKHDHIAGAELYGTLEVARVPFVMLINVPADRKRRPRGKRANKIGGLIGRGIVTYYQLIGRSVLSEYALQLLSQKALAIVGNQSD